MMNGLYNCFHNRNPMRRVLKTSAAKRRAFQIKMYATFLFGISITRALPQCYDRITDVYYTTKRGGASLAYSTFSDIFLIFRARRDFYRAYCDFLQLEIAFYALYIKKSSVLFHYTRLAGAAISRPRFGNRFERRK